MYSCFLVAVTELRELGAACNAQDMSEIAMSSEHTCSHKQLYSKSHLQTSHSGAYTASCASPGLTTNNYRNNANHVVSNRQKHATCAHCMRATLPSQSIFWADSSGRAVAQSTTVWMPTSAAGMEVGSFKSTCNSKSGGKDCMKSVELRRQGWCVPVQWWLPSLVGNLQGFVEA